MIVCCNWLVFRPGKKRRGQRKTLENQQIKTDLIFKYLQIESKKIVRSLPKIRFSQPVKSLNLDGLLTHSEFTYNQPDFPLNADCFAWHVSGERINEL